MSSIIQGAELRSLVLGRYVQGQTSDFTSDGDATYQVFTVAGGEVLITALWGLVTTVIAAGNGTVALQMDPTTGDTDTWIATTDLGGTDTLAGDILGVVDNNTATPDFSPNRQPLMNYIATTGEIEAVGASSVDGVVEWYCTYVPLTPGATVVAATGGAA
jgi:hypothetical protein